MGVKNDVTIYKLKKSVHIEGKWQNITGEIVYEVLKYVLNKELVNTDLDEDSKKIFEYLKNDKSSIEDARFANGKNKKIIGIHTFLTTPETMLEKFYGKSVSKYDWKNLKKGKLVGSIGIFKEGTNYYAICSGYGIYVIQSILENDFGIQILLRITEAQEKVSYQSEVGLIDNSAKIESHYFEGVNLDSLNSFTVKIKTQLSSKVTTEILKKNGILEITEKPIKSPNSTIAILKTLNFGKGFSLNNGQETVKTLMKRIKALNKICNKKVKRELNVLKVSMDDEMYHEIQKSFYIELGKSIFSKEYNKIYLYNQSKVNKIRRLDVGIKGSLKKNNHTFLELPSSQVFFESEIISKLFLQEQIEKDITDYIDKIRMYSSSKSDMEGTTKQNLLNFIHYFFIHNHTTYYFAENEIYSFNNNYINEIDTEYKKRVNISEYSLPAGILKKYKNESEGVYNSRYKSGENSICLDELYLDPSNKFEIADFIIVENGITYICHAKCGFGGNTRILQKQVSIAYNYYRRETVTKDSEKQFWERVLKLTDKLESEKQLFLQEIIKSKKVIFVAVILGKSKKMSIKSGSIQAKLAIINLTQEIDQREKEMIKLSFM